MKTSLIAVSFAIVFSANAAEIIKGENGSIILDSKPNPTIYKDITQSRDGIYRDLIQTNSTPALFTSGGADIIYTLKEENGKIIIDCAIAETRSNQTGISIRKSMCNINKELDADYAELGYIYTDQWKDEVSSIDITKLTQSMEPLDIIKGNLNGIEIHERYNTISQLKNTTPETYLKKGKNCYNIPDNKTFINYSTTNPSQPLNISILTDAENYIFNVYEQKDLNSLDYIPCSGK
ncbi:conserved exported hypothetical protein [Pseudomonas sp. 8AS]|uniref:hypothetical protein n=1 Tax=Pseudomonas sp. 8AS TaxID=2653163 RepID=UPI0012EF2265|nr:hypothetical protein [Pseudomonas sp. 8AS]VXB03368.1 conserved exported hypothetical protein [Pseudomonas sp. 8AS]